MNFSKYSSCWKQLKQNPNEPLVIAAHKAHHRRIYKAVIKQKYEDSVWHLEMSDAELRGTLSKRSVGDMLEIRLTIEKFISYERMF